jgi:electron transport complex protein RnfD
MSLVLVMLLPAAVVHVVLFGPGLLLQIGVAIGAALATEALLLQWCWQPVKPALSDLSGIVTAVLLAFALPPLAPWWIAAVAASIAIAVGKHAFGGLGRNLFNPAMVGYAAILLAFPAQVTLWPDPSAEPPGLVATAAAVFAGTSTATLDAITGATPLDAVRTGLVLGKTMQETRAELFGTFGGHGAEWLALAFLAGGIGLIGTRVIRWHIPVGMLGAIVIFGGMLHGLDPGTYPDVLFQLVNGATLLGAFFIACDPVTTATSHRGRLLFGIGVGLITIAIRAWGHYPDGVAFAVLIMNAAAPLLDRYTIPRIYGHA